MKKYDYIIAGSGLFGAVFAHEAVKKGKKVGLIDAVSLKVIFPAEYDYIWYSNGGYEIVKDGKTIDKIAVEKDITFEEWIKAGKPLNY